MISNKEILKTVVSTLSEFQTGKIPLHQLASELLSLQDNIEEESLDPQWFAEFDRQRTDIEVINALRLSGDTEITGSDDEVVLMDLIKQFRSLVCAFLDSEQG